MSDKFTEIEALLGKISTELRELRTTQVVRPQRRHRRWTREQKELILSEADSLLQERGVLWPLYQKYAISSGHLSNWKKELNR